MSSTDAAWNDLNRAVLEVFNSTPLSVQDVRESLPDVPDAYVRTSLSQSVEWGFLSVQPGIAHALYRITEAGRRHLASVKVG